MKITVAQWHEIIRKRTADVDEVNTKYHLNVSDFIRDQYIYNMRGLTIMYAQ